MRLHAAFVLSTLLLASVPAALAATQDDANSGGDAPSTDAVPPLMVSLGTFTGRLDAPAGDAVDWYGYELLEPSLVRIEGARLAGDGVEFHVYLNGTLVFDSYFSWSPRVFEGPLAPGLVRIVIWTNYVSTTSDYQVTLTTAGLPDGTVSTPTIEVVRSDTEVYDVPITTQRLVRVEVGNIGKGPAAGTVRAWVTTIGSTREIGRLSLEVASGSSATLEIPWDGTGQIGDAVVHVAFDVPHDLDPTDNAARAQGHVVVQNAGFGIDLLNHNVGGWPAPAHVAHWYDGHGAGVFVSASVAETSLNLGRDGTTRLSTCTNTYLRVCV